MRAWPTSPCVGTPSLAVLITAIGVSYFLQNAALLIWSSSPKTLYPHRYLPASAVWLADSWWSPATVILTPCAYVHHHDGSDPGLPPRPSTGKAMRAVSEDQGRCPAHGHQRKPDHFHDLCHRLRSGGRCRCAAVLHGSDLAAHHRLHARYPGLYCRGFRRHRLHSRGYAGRYSAGHYRDASAKPISAPSSATRSCLPS